MNFFRSVFSVDPEPDSEEGDETVSEVEDETAASAAAAAAATMDFFKSVFSNSPDENEPDPDEDEDHDRDQDQKEQQEPSDRGQIEEEGGEIDEGEEEEEDGGTNGGWGLGFGGLIKTFAHKSETVIRDLEEFGQGLKAETAVLRDVASKALDVGASAAQESLESMGQVVDDLGDTFRQGTAEIISQSKEALLSLDAPPSPSSESAQDSSTHASSSSRPILTRLTRYESQMLAARSDTATFADLPEDQQDFDAWKEKFKLEEKKEEIEVTLKENSQIELFLEKLVPSLVDEETFWSRYFYKVNKIKLAEDARAKIVNLAVKGDEEEDLSWDVEEDEEEQKQEEEEKIEVKEEEKEKIEIKEEEKEKIEIKEEEKEKVMDEQAVVETSNGESNGESNGDEITSKSSEFSVVSRSQAAEQEEEDLGWEAIEELGENNNEEKKNDGLIDPNGPKVEDLKKRVSASKEEEEELSWDIEDEET